MKDYLNRRATEAVSRVRPFCRRLFNTLRPEAVWLRLRKPNLRARRNLEGLYVGFIGKTVDIKNNCLKVKTFQGVKLSL